MQPWRRWREPLAVLLLVASALLLAVRAVAFAVNAGAASDGGLSGSIPGGDDLMLLATAAAVLWCATPLPTTGPADDGETGAGATHAALSPHVWPIAVAGLVVVGLTVFGWLTLSVLDVIALLRWQTPDTGFVLLVAEGLIRLAVPIVSFAAMIVAAARAAAARAGKTEGARWDRSDAVGAGAQAEDVPAVATAPERLPAAWQADEATGAVWLTADDAAEGRPGLSWSEPSAAGGPAATQGWNPAPAGDTSDRSSAAPGPPSADQDDDLH